MPAKNINNLLYLNEVPFPDACPEVNPRIMLPAEFTQKYGITPDGVNLYFGVNSDAVTRVQTVNAALEPDMRNVLDALLASMTPESNAHKYVDLSLEPIEIQNPFDFVNSDPAIAIISQLATELGEYQTKAAGAGNELKIVIRFASEMNDPATCGQPYGRPIQNGVGLPHGQQAAAFKASFIKVKAAMKAANGNLRFTFSPAIRADITGNRYTMIQDYWPGNGVADQVSCTWYTGGSSDLTGSVAVMTQYFTDWKAFTGLNLFGIDELGGVIETIVPLYNQQIEVDHDNDEVLCPMFTALAGLADKGITFENVSVFLLDKWGIDATLSCLKPAVSTPSPAAS